jgi:16S rRNA (uracil1498-N3)-methyltransferase
MQLFYARYQELDTACTLDENESSHLIHVLRKKVGDTISICNGYGLLSEATISVAHAKYTQLSIVKLLNKIESQHPYRLHIAIAPTKNMDRIENFVEKACELGIDEITPIICERSERKEIKIERLQKIALSAMKQSGSLFLPKLNEAVSFKKFTENRDVMYICTCEGERNPISNINPINNSYTFLIGPEGDFSPTEISLISNNVSNKLVELGPKRLRTETAGIFISAYLYAKYL